MKRKIAVYTSLTVVPFLIATILLIVSVLVSKPAISKPEQIYSIVLNETEIKLIDQVPHSVTATLYPNDFNPDFIYSSSNDDIISVNSGEVIAKKNGVAAVIVSATVGSKEYESFCTVVVDILDAPSFDEPLIAEEIPEDPGPPVPAIPDPVIDETGFLISDNISEYYDYNKATVGWLYIPSTNINLPIAQSSEAEKDFYLSHGFNFYPKNSGSAFSDYRCSLNKGYINDQQTVIYGHARGTDIFDQLEKVTILDSWFNIESNRYVYFNSLTQQSVWKVFATYYTDFDNKINEASLITPNFILSREDVEAKYSHSQILAATSTGKMDELYRDNSKLISKASAWQERVETSDKRYKPFASRMLNREYDAPLEENSKVITLITCADADSNVRYVLQAKLIKIRDSFTLKEEEQ